MYKFWSCTGVLVMLIAAMLKLFSSLPTAELIWMYLMGLGLVLVYKK